MIRVFSVVAKMRNPPRVASKHTTTLKGAAYPLTRLEPQARRPAHREGDAGKGCWGGAIVPALKHEVEALDKR